MDVVEWRAVARGAVAGLIVIAPLTVLRAILDHNVTHFDSSAWVPLFALGLFAAYALAGLLAGRAAPDAPLSNGMLAGVGALVAWIVVRILIWLAREPEKTLFGGPHAVFTTGNLFGAVLFAAVFGLAGGLIGARLESGGESARRPRPGPAPSRGVGDPAEERPDSTGHGAG